MHSQCTTALFRQTLHCAAPQPTQCSPHRLPLLLPQVRVPGSADGVGVDKDPLQQLSNVKMCMMCQAQGTVKRQYGFRVMDEQCENCNGEGCIITRPPSTADKIAKVEALIASATDLDSLQRCVHMRMHMLHGHGTWTWDMGHGTWTWTWTWDMGHGVWVWACACVVNGAL